MMSVDLEHLAAIYCRCVSSPEWTNVGHVERYLDRADEFPRRAEGEGALLEQAPRDAPS